MTDPDPGRTQFATAVLALHATLDAWAAAVAGVSDESGQDPTDALADPRLEAAQDSFYEALGVYEEATLPVLGLVALSEDDEANEADGVDRVMVDDFFVHLVVGVARDDSPDRLADAFEMVHDAAHSIVDRLVTAGFLVPTFSSSRGELDVDDFDDFDDFEPDA